MKLPILRHSARLKTDTVSDMYMVQEVTVSKAEADEARAAAETATPRMQATSRFGVCYLPAPFGFLCMQTIMLSEAQA